MHNLRVLFVCLGNICRSPMAEAVFRQLVEREGLADHFEIDSAGTSGAHAGEPAHPETLEQLRLNSVPAGAMRSRQLIADDLEQFDYVVAMDSSNLQNLRALAGAEGAHAHTSLLLDHASDAEGDVPDPWYEGGYDHVYDLVVDGCAGLLELICEREGIARRAG